MPTAAYFFPLIGAFIGYVTNYVAVRMIFRPRRAFRMGPLVIQGLLPRRKEAFARKIGEAVEAHLFSNEDIVRILADPDVRKAIERGVDQRMDKLAAAIREKIPMAAMMLTPSLIEKAREHVMKLAEGLIEDVSGHLEDAVDMHAIIREKIEGFDLERLERIVLDVAQRELRFIELAGAVLGAIVGAIQMLLVP